MKKLIIILGIMLLLACLITVYNKLQEEPKTPEVELDSKKDSEVKKEMPPEIEKKTPPKIDQTMTDETSEKEVKTEQEKASGDKLEQSIPKEKAQTETNGSVKLKQPEPEHKEEPSADPVMGGEWSDFESVSAEVLKGTSAGDDPPE